MFQKWNIAIPSAVLGYHIPQALLQSEDIHKCRRSCILNFFWNTGSQKCAIFQLGSHQFFYSGNQGNTLCDTSDDYICSFYDCIMVILSSCNWFNHLSLSPPLLLFPADISLLKVCNKAQPQLPKEKLPHWSPRRVKEACWMCNFLT